MIEDQELIDLTLETVGEILSFDTADIYAIAGFQTTMLFKNDAIVNGTETQEFHFSTATSYCIDNDILEGLLFTTTDGIYLYNFKVMNNPIPQLDGWSRFPASYISKELL